MNSFSGAHPFRPQCIIDRLAGLDEDEIEDQAARVTSEIDSGRCPRCGGPLPQPPIFPAGSEVTACRCIPICGMCGDHETMMDVEFAMAKAAGEDFPEITDGLEDWPIAGVIEDMERRITQPPPNVEIAKVPVDRIVLPPPTSGWSKFGYDDTPDRDEQER
jgi:hypothetical protein